MLAIETATPVCSVAILDGNEVLAELTRHSYQRHNELLALSVNQILSTANLQMSDISSIALSIGPGSFTGLRVGLSFAKGLSLALNAPIVPIKSLNALAHSIAEEAIDTAPTICPLITARKGEAFGKLIKFEDDKLVTILTTFCGDVDFILNLLKKQNVIVGGPGADLLFEERKDKLANSTIYIENYNSSAASVGRLAQNSTTTVSTAQSSRDIEPMYLKEFTVTPRKSS